MNRINGYLLLAVLMFIGAAWPAAAQDRFGQLPGEPLVDEQTAIKMRGVKPAFMPEKPGQMDKPERRRLHASLKSDIEEQIEKMREAYGVAGLAVAVVEGQETVLSKGFGVQSDGGAGAYTSQTVCHMYSATKALSSLVIASMVEDGLLDLNVPLDVYLEDAPPMWSGIPFWRLFNHTSGITTIIDKPEFGEISEDPTSTNADIYDVVKTYPLDYEPGQFSQYRQSGYAIAEMIISRHLGATWPELVAEHVTEPAGTLHTYHAALASGGRSSPLLTSAGGYQTTTDDMSAIFKALNAGQIVASDFLERLLYTKAYDFEGYSLGSILETYDGVRTLGHRGGGARATVRYVPSKQVGVAVFTDQIDNNELAVHVADMLIRKVALEEEVLPPISVLLFSRREHSASEIISFYREASERSNQEYDFARAEWSLNRLGYILLRSERVEDAIEVFLLNTQEHPTSANTHDSLGEAYFENGDLDLALQSYRRSLDLNPANRNAEAMIEKIEATRE